MNKENAKEYLPLVQAMAEGKVIEMCDDKYENWVTLSELNFTGPSSQYRIKQSPSLRPWKPKEVPVGALMKRINEQLPNFNRWMIGGVDNQMLYLALPYLENNGQSFETAVKDWVHSTDQGKTWLPCGVPIQ